MSAWTSMGSGAISGGATGFMLGGPWGAAAGAAAGAGLGYAKHKEEKDKHYRRRMLEAKRTPYDNITGKSSNTQEAAAGPDMANTLLQAVGAYAVQKRANEMHELDKQIKAAYINQNGGGQQPMQPPMQPMQGLQPPTMLQPQPQPQPQYNPWAQQNYSMGNYQLG